MREMKESGIEWIGEIPKDWDITKIKYLFYVISGGTPPPNEENWDGNVIWITPADYKTGDRFVSQGKRNISQIGCLSSSATLVPAGSIIFSKRAPIGSVAISSVCLSTNQGCLSCVKKANVDVRYFYYIMSISTEQFELLGSGTTFKEISANNFSDFDLPLPSFERQITIADFLDRKCSEIDSLTADIEEQIDTLEQYKKSVITEAVTKGLDPDAEMKDSGVEWIGSMPSHWGCIRGKYILSYLQKPVREDDGVITCFRDGEVTLRSNRREDGFTMSEKEIGYQGIDIGDLVVHGMDGFAGAIGISDSRGKGSPVLNVLGTEQNKRYIMYYLRSMAYSDVFIATATGIRVRSCDLRWNKLADLFYPIPPMDEQQKIVDYIDETIYKTDAVIADKQSQLDTLANYKKSIIYEYVTGKKEVPSV